MSTSYYLLQDYCDKCGRYDELKIGTAAAGWHFSLYIYPKMGITDLDSWIKMFKEHKIIDEYGREVPVDEMLMIITERSWEKAVQGRGEGRKTDDVAEDGVNGLTAHKASPYRKVIRTDGPYDLIYEEGRGHHPERLNREA